MFEHRKTRTKGGEQEEKEKKAAKKLLFFSPLHLCCSENRSKTTISSFLLWPKRSTMTYKTIGRT
jgi:hypothetical protein